MGKGSGIRGSLPGERRGGRKKGTPNKATVETKAALEAAFEGAGGVPKLIQWAQLNPDGFYPLWAKLLPKNLDVTSGGKPLNAEDRTKRLDAILAVLEARARSR